MPTTKGKEKNRSIGRICKHRKAEALSIVAEKQTLVSVLELTFTHIFGCTIVI